MNLKNNINKLYLLLFYLLAASACEQKIALDLEDYEGKIVVQSILEPGQSPQVFLTKSRALLGFSEVSSIEFVTDATVTITVDGQVNPLELEVGNEQFNGFQSTPNGYYSFADTLELFYYTTDMEVEVGKTYELNISRPGQEVYAETKVPTPVEIGELNFEQTTWTYEWGEEYTDTYLKALFSDVEGEENFYVIEQSYGELQAIYEYVIDPNTGEIIGDEIVDTIPQTNTNIRWYDIQSDEGLDGNDFSLYVYLPSGRNWWIYPPLPVDTISVEVKLRSISPELGKFYDSLDEQEWTEGDPTVEPVRIWSNIQGGLGVFGSLSSSEPKYYDHIVYDD